MPAAAVIQIGQALFTLIRRKGYVDGFVFNCKISFLNESAINNISLRIKEDIRIVQERVKSYDMDRNVVSEGVYLFYF